jgi:hypothetical protein
VYLRNGPNPRFTPLGSYVYLGCVKDLGQVLGVDHAAAVAAVR